MGCRTADFLIRRRRQQDGAPPFIGLIPLDDAARKRAILRTHQFLRGQPQRLEALFRQFPNLATWLVTQSLSEGYPVFLMTVMCFALFACAFNLLLGYGGLLSFGHAAYFGGASYVSAHAAKVWGLSPELAILAGAGAACILGLAIGMLAIRRQGIYFAMVTLAFAQMVFFVSLQAPFTGGEDGIQAVPRGSLFGLLDVSSSSNFSTLR